MNVNSKEVINAICEVTNENRLLYIISELSALMVDGIPKISNHFEEHNMSTAFAKMMSSGVPGCSYSYAYGMFNIKKGRTVMAIGSSIAGYVQEHAFSSNNGVRDRLIRSHIGGDSMHQASLRRTIKEFYREPDRKEKFIISLLVLITNTYNPIKYIELLLDKVVCNGNLNHIVKYPNPNTSIASLILPMMTIDCMQYVKVPIDYRLAKSAIKGIWLKQNVSFIHIMDLELPDLIDLHYATDCKYPMMLLQLSKAFSIITIWDTIDKLSLSQKSEMCKLFDLPYLH